MKPGALASWRDRSWGGLDEVISDVKAEGQSLEELAWDHPSEDRRNFTG